MPRISPQAVLPANAIFAALAGVLLVLAPASGLYENLGLPVAEPEIYAQLAGGLLLLAAVLLWEAPADAVLERHVGRAAAAANVIAAAVLVLWLLSGDLETSRRGAAILWAVTVLTAGFAVLEARYLRAQPP